MRRTVVVSLGLFLAAAQPLGAAPAPVKTLMAAWVPPLLRTLGQAQPGPVRLGAASAQELLREHLESQTLPARWLLPVIRALEEDWAQTPETFEELLLAPGETGLGISAQSREGLLLRALAAASRRAEQAALVLALAAAGEPRGARDDVRAYSEALQLWLESEPYLAEVTRRNFAAQVLPQLRARVAARARGRAEKTETALRGLLEEFDRSGAAKVERSHSEAAVSSALAAAALLRFDPVTAREDRSLLEQTKARHVERLQAFGAAGNAGAFWGEARRAFAQLGKSIRAHHRFQKVEEGHGGPWARATLDSLSLQVDVLSEWVGALALSHGIAPRPQAAAWREREGLALLLTRRRKILEEAEAPTSEERVAFHRLGRASQDEASFENVRVALGYFRRRLISARDPRALKEIRDLARGPGWSALKPTVPVPLRVVHHRWRQMQLGAATPEELQEGEGPRWGPGLRRLWSSAVQLIERVLGLWGIPGGLVTALVAFVLRLRRVLLRRFARIDILDQGDFADLARPLRR